MEKKAMDWLSKVRKLDAGLVESMGVRAGSHPQLGEAIAFPYNRNGERYADKYRGIESKGWRSTQGVSRGLYNEDCLGNGSSPIVITEGEMDALSCIQAGYVKSVSLPDGWSADGEKRQCLLDNVEKLRKASYVIVAGDNDEAGKSLPRAVANILLGHDVRYVTWPQDCKDANDVLVKYGEGELSRCLQEASQLDPEGGFITGISDLPPMPERRVLRVGVHPFDQALAFEVGALSIGTGTPGSGKSTFTTFAAYHVALNEKVRVGFASFETHPHQQRDHLCRLKTRKPWDDLTKNEKSETAEFLDRHFRIVHREFDGENGGSINTPHNLGWLFETVQTLAIRDNCKLIVIDPWNELEHMPEKGESLTNYINFALQQMRTWASRFGCHICLIAHPKKMNSEHGNKPPLGYDVADSSAFYNKPALGFTVHQDNGEEGIDHVKIITWKVRNTQLYGFGKALIKVIFDAHKMSYIPYRSQEVQND